MSEQGEGLNIRKATLREWRREFARHLRDQGIAANATERAVRGESRTHKKDGIYRAAQRGNSSYLRSQAEDVARQLVNGHLCSEPGKRSLVQTRRDVERGWRNLASQLAIQGQVDIAREVGRLVEALLPVKTDRERVVDSLRKQTQRPAVRDMDPSR